MTTKMDSINNGDSVTEYFNRHKTAKLKVTPPPTKALAYIRVSSTEEQVKNGSLPRQEKAIDRYCTDNSLTLHKVFREEGESAKNGDRTQFLRMLDYCTQHKDEIRCCIFEKIDRSMRNNDEHYWTKSFLKKLGIKTVNLDCLPTGDYVVDKFSEAIKVVLADVELHTIRERTKAGIRFARESGCYLSGSFLGYIQDKEAPGYLRVNEDQAGTIRKIFRMRLKGDKPQKILKYLQRIGFKTLKGNPITNQTLYRLLRNEIYAGLIWLKNEEKYIKGKFPEIISEDLFFAVQKLLSSSKAKGNKRKSDREDIPLKRSILCGVCGTPLTGSFSKGNGGKYLYYRCRKCGKKAVSVRGETLEADFKKLLSKILVNDDNYPLLEHVLQKRHKTRQEEIIDEIDGLTANERKMQSRIDELYKMRLDGKINDNRFEQQSDLLETELTTLQEELRCVRNSICALEELLDDVIPKLDDLTAIRDEIDFEDWLEFFSAVFPEKLKYTTKGGFEIPAITPLFYLPESS